MHVRSLPAEFFNDPMRGLQEPLRNAEETERRRARCARAEDPAAEYKKYSCKFSSAKCGKVPFYAHFMLILCSFYVHFPVQPEIPGFNGTSCGANSSGIFMACGPDKMHLLYEGLGKHLVTCIAKMLKKHGKLSSNVPGL
jgi:hypothetical protein